MRCPCSNYRNYFSSTIYTTLLFLKIFSFIYTSCINFENIDMPILNTIINLLFWFVSEMTNKYRIDNFIQWRRYTFLTGISFVEEYFTWNKKLLALGTPFHRNFLFSGVLGDVSHDHPCNYATDFTSKGENDEKIFKQHFWYTLYFKDVRNKTKVILTIMKNVWIQIIFL